MLLQLNINCIQIVYWIRLMDKSFIEIGFLEDSMGSIGKCFALALILTVAISGLSPLMLKAANAQSIPKPSVPEFTLRYIKSSYNVTTFDAYIGANITQKIDNSTVELAIKNQPYTNSIDNTTHYLFYDFQTKSHFKQDWTDHYPLISLMSDTWTGTYSWYISAKGIKQENSPSLPASNSSYTTLSFPAKSYPINTAFQVRAFLGHNSHYFIPKHLPFQPYDLGTFRQAYNRSAIAYDTSSDWSDTQTVSLPQTSPTPTPSPPVSVQPTQNTPTLLIVATTIILLVTVVSVLLYRKHRKTSANSV
jgi:hypothetical protein